MDELWDRQREPEGALDIALPNIVVLPPVKTPASAVADRISDILESRRFEEIVDAPLACHLRTVSIPVYAHDCLGDRAIADRMRRRSVFQQERVGSRRRGGRRDSEVKMPSHL